jgi:hypothetical protein
MEDFEQHLKNALARKNPSPWFEQKVMDAVARPLPQRGRAWFHFAVHGRLRWTSALAAAAVLVTGVVWQRERMAEERAQGEAAKARLQLALQITSTKLRKIQERVDAMHED